MKTNLGMFEELNQIEELRLRSKIKMVKYTLKNSTGTLAEKLVIKKRIKELKDELFQFKLTFYERQEHYLTTKELL